MMEENKKKTRVTPWKMKQLRKEEWKRSQKEEDLEDLDKVWRPQEVLQEDIQDRGVQKIKMLDSKLAP